MLFDVNGKQIGGIPVSDIMKTEDIYVTLYNHTSGTQYLGYLSEEIFVCNNTNYTAHYFDDNEDGILDNDDYFIIFGQTEGCFFRIHHVNGKSIYEITFH